MKMAFQEQADAPYSYRKFRGISSTESIIKDIFAIHVRLFFSTILGNDTYESEITGYCSVRGRELLN
jgi:hypothetical protein